MGDDRPAPATAGHPRGSASTVQPAAEVAGSKQN